MKTLQGNDKFVKEKINVLTGKSVEFKMVYNDEKVEVRDSVIIEKNIKEKDETNSVSLENFIFSQQRDKQNIPPLRIVLVGDDKVLGQFVRDYVRLIGFDMEDEKEEESRFGSLASRGELPDL